MRERREGETCSHITGPGNEPLCKPASQPGGAEHRVGGGAGARTGAHSAARRLQGLHNGKHNCVVLVPPCLWALWRRLGCGS